MFTFHIISLVLPLVHSILTDDLASTGDIMEEGEPIVPAAGCIGWNPLLIEHLMRNAMKLVENRPYLLCQVILQGVVQLKHIVSLQRLAFTLLLGKRQGLLEGLICLPDITYSQHED